MEGEGPSSLIPLLLLLLLLPPPGEKTENRLFSGPRNLLTDREKKCSERNSGELIKNAGQDEHYLVEGAKKSPRSYF